MKALNAFLNTKSWAEARRVLETQWDLLRQPQVADFLEQLAGQAKDENQKGIFLIHAQLLRDARQDGIPAAFERLENAMWQAQAGSQANQGMAAFIARCAQGLRSGEAEKQELAGYLRGLPKDNPGFSRLINALQLWVMGDDPATLDAFVPDEFRPVWDEIKQQVLGAPPPPSS